MEFFSQRRLSRLLLQEEKRKCALDAAKSGAVAVEATVVRIVEACAAKVAAVHTKAGLYRRSHALLKHIETVSTSRRGRPCATYRRARATL
jgi:mRNA-degrading endonuclease toxin of MazEF toxin-antitoxin module